jgi:hypothetical protein
METLLLLNMPKNMHVSYVAIAHLSEGLYLVVVHVDEARLSLNYSQQRAFFHDI